MHKTHGFLRPTYSIDRQLQFSWSIMRLPVAVAVAQRALLQAGMRDQYFNGRLTSVDLQVTILLSSRQRQGSKRLLQAPKVIM